MRKLTKRMKVKDENSITRITQSNLRGGMQDRLHRQELIRYADAVKKHKKRISSDKNNNRLNASFRKELDEFVEPEFRRIRSKRGFFDNE